MPLISGQASGLIIGIAMILLYSLIYIGIKAFSNSERNRSKNIGINRKVNQSKLATEFSEELTDSTGKVKKCCKEECNHCDKE